MNIINIWNRQTLKMLNGCEFQSLKHEGTVLVSGNKLYMDGKVIETINTNAKVSYLMDQYFRDS